MNCQNGRFVQNDTLLGRENDRVDCAQVNRQIIGEEAAEDIHNDCTPWLRISRITATYMPAEGGERQPRFFSAVRNFSHKPIAATIR
jgi:hypothetical protein